MYAIVVNGQNRIEFFLSLGSYALLCIFNF